MSNNKFTKDQAEIVLYRLRKSNLNAFLIGSIALKEKGNDIDIILLDAPDNWKEIVSRDLAPATFTPNDWGGGLFQTLSLKVDIFIKNPDKKKSGDDEKQ